MNQEILKREQTDTLEIVKSLKYYPVCPVCKAKTMHFVLLAADFPVYQCRECFTPWRIVLPDLL